MANHHLYYYCLLIFITIPVIKSESEGSIEFDCPPDDQGVLYPHPDCTKYRECNDGQLYIRNCSLGTYYNHNTKLCDFPENVPECVGGTRPVDYSNAPTTPMITSTTIQSESPTTVPPSGSPVVQLLLHSREVVKNRQHKIDDQ